jgi:hypothetical protein
MSCSIYHASMGAYVALSARSKVGSIIKKYKWMMLNFELLIKKIKICIKSLFSLFNTFDKKLYP